MVLTGTAAVIFLIVCMVLWAGDSLGKLYSWYSRRDPPSPPKTYDPSDPSKRERLW